MSEENPALREALLGAKQVPDDSVDMVENCIEDLGSRIKGDLIKYNGRNYLKNHETIAALLCHSNAFRKLAVDNGFNIAQFDQQIQVMRQAWLLKTNKEHPGTKYLTVLRKKAGL